MAETKEVKIKLTTVVCFLVILLLLAGYGAIYYFGILEKDKKLEKIKEEKMQTEIKMQELEMQKSALEKEKQPEINNVEEKEKTEEAIELFSKTGEKLFEEYLSKQKDLKTYKINSCKMIYYYNDEFVCSINYDVEPNGNVEESKWLAGNGEISENIIKGKGVFVNFKKVNDKYVYDEEAGQSTGWSVE